MSLILNISCPEHDDIKFVTYDNTRSGRVHDLRTRQLVRKQARRASQRTRDSDSSRGVARSLKESKGRFRLQKQSSVLPYAFEQDGIEALISPFTPTIRSLGDDAPTLLNYCKLLGIELLEEADLTYGPDCYVFQSKCVAINFESDWLAFILSNAATAHALLALVALSYDSQAHGSFCSRNARHNVAAVTMIRQQLDDTSSVSDTMICAIALLTVSESIQDDEMSSTAHFRGLQEMIRIRGGSYDAFAHCRTLQKIMSWARRIYCLRSHQPLTLPAVPSSGRASFDFMDEEVECWKEFDSLSFIRNDFSNVVSRELDELINGLHILSSFPQEQARTPAQRTQISHCIYNIEYRLILLNQSHLSNLSGLSSNHATLSRSFQLAVQLYVTAALRRVQPRSALVQRYVNALRSEAGRRQLPRKELDSASTRSWILLLLWMETVLAAVTIEPADRMRSMSFLRMILEHAGSESLTEYMKLLKEVCWLDGYLEQEVKDIYEHCKTQ